MIALLLSHAGRAVSGVALGAALLSGVYLYGHSRGAASERHAILTRSDEILRERNATDDQVRNMSDADLCRSLGGVFADGTCQ